MSQCHDPYPDEGYETARIHPVPGSQCHDPSCGYDDDCVELVLANAVRDWAQRVAPGDDATVRSAVETALYLFASGASVSEACEEARKRVLSRLRHPSRGRSVHRYAAAS